MVLCTPITRHSMTSQVAESLMENGIEAKAFQGSVENIYDVKKVTIQNVARESQLSIVANGSLTNNAKPWGSPTWGSVALPHTTSIKGMR